MTQANPLSPMKFCIYLQEKAFFHQQVIFSFLRAVTFQVLTHANDWVTVNVGGKRFSTTRSTLGKDPNSMLAKMFGSDWESQKDESGAYLIDRTPEYFAPILNFLRCGQIIIDPGVNVEGKNTFLSSRETLLIIIFVLATKYWHQ